METGTSIVRAAVALAAAVMLFAAMPRDRDRAVAPKTGAEPNLFPFLKPIERIGPDMPAKSLGGPQSFVPSDAPLAPTDIALVQAAAQKMRVQGAGSEDIDGMRAAALSPEMATRLALIESEEAKWKSRVNAYLSERSRLLDSSKGVPETAQEQTLQLLRDTRFTSDEQALLAAYEPSKFPQLTQDPAIDRSSTPGNLPAY